MTPLYKTTDTDGAERAETTMKRCTKCDKQKPASDENFARTVYDRFQSWCRACHLAWHREQRTSNLGRIERERHQSRAYARATRRLRENHRGEFASIYAEELAKDEVPA